MKLPILALVLLNLACCSHGLFESFLSYFGSERQAADSLATLKTEVQTFLNNVVVPNARYPEEDSTRRLLDDNSGFWPDYCAGPQKSSCGPGYSGKKCGSGQCCMGTSQSDAICTPLPDMSYCVEFHYGTTQIYASYSNDATCKFTPTKKPTSRPTQFPTFAPSAFPTRAPTQLLGVFEPTKGYLVKNPLGVNCSTPKVEGLPSSEGDVPFFDLSVGELALQEGPDFSEDLLDVRSFKVTEVKVLSSFGEVKGAAQLVAVHANMTIVTSYQARVNASESLAGIVLANSGSISCSEVAGTFTVSSMEIVVPVQFRLSVDLENSKVSVLRPFLTNLREAYLPNGAGSLQSILSTATGAVSPAQLSTLLSQVDANSFLTPLKMLTSETYASRIESRMAKTQESSGQSKLVQSTQTLAASAEKALYSQICPAPFELLPRIDHATEYNITLSSAHLELNNSALESLSSLVHNQDGDNLGVVNLYGFELRVTEDIIFTRAPLELNIFVDHVVTSSKRTIRIPGGNVTLHIRNNTASTGRLEFDLQGAPPSNSKVWIQDIKIKLPRTVEGYLSYETPTWYDSLPTSTGMFRKGTEEKTGHVVGPDCYCSADNKRLNGCCAGMYPNCLSFWTHYDCGCHDGSSKPVSLVKDVFHLVNVPYPLTSDQARMLRGGNLKVLLDSESSNVQVEQTQRFTSYMDYDVLTWDTHLDLIVGLAALQLVDNITQVMADNPTAYANAIWDLRADLIQPCKLNKLGDQTVCLSTSAVYYDALTNACGGYNSACSSSTYTKRPNSAVTGALESMVQFWISNAGEYSYTLLGETNLLNQFLKTPVAAQGGSALSSAMQDLFATSSVLSYATAAMKQTAYQYAIISDINAFTSEAGAAVVMQGIRLKAFELVASGLDLYQYGSPMRAPEQFAFGVLSRASGTSTPIPYDFFSFQVLLDCASLLNQIPESSTEEARPQLMFLSSLGSDARELTAMESLDVQQQASGFDAQVSAELVQVTDPVVAAKNVQIPPYSFQTISAAWRDPVGGLVSQLQAMEDQIQAHYNKANSLEERRTALEQMLQQQLTLVKSNQQLLDMNIANSLQLQAAQQLAEYNVNQSNREADYAFDAFEDGIEKYKRQLRDAEPSTFQKIMGEVLFVLQVTSSVLTLFQAFNEFFAVRRDASDAKNSYESISLEDFYDAQADVYDIDAYSKVLAGKASSQNTYLKSTARKYADTVMVIGSVSSLMKSAMELANKPAGSTGSTPTLNWERNQGASVSTYEIEAIKEANRNNIQWALDMGIEGAVELANAQAKAALMMQANVAAADSLIKAASSAARDTVEQTLLLNTAASIQSQIDDLDRSINTVAGESLTCHRLMQANRMIVQKIKFLCAAVSYARSDPSSRCSTELDVKDIVQTTISHRSLQPAIDRLSYWLNQNTYFDEGNYQVLGYMKPTKNLWIFEGADLPTEGNIVSDAFMNSSSILEDLRTTGNFTFEVFNQSSCAQSGEYALDPFELYTNIKLENMYVELTFRDGSVLSPDALLTADTRVFTRGNDGHMYAYNLPPMQPLTVHKDSPMNPGANQYIHYPPYSTWRWSILNKHRISNLDQVEKVRVVITGIAQSRCSFLRSSGRGLVRGSSRAAAVQKRTSRT